MLDYTRVSLKFADNEDSIERIATESQTRCDVQIEESLGKTFREIELQNEQAQLLKEDKNLIAQIKYVK